MQVQEQGKIIMTTIINNKIIFFIAAASTSKVIFSTATINKIKQLDHQEKQLLIW